MMIRKNCGEKKRSHGVNIVSRKDVTQWGHTENLEEILNETLKMTLTTQLAY